MRIIKKISLKTVCQILFRISLGVLALTVSFTIEGQEGRVSSARDDKEMREFKSQFPTALYDPPVSSNVLERNQREAKGRRYDNRRRLVSPEEPQDDDGSLVFFDEAPGRKQLPIKESGLIVIGRVLEARAFVSNDRKNVYSEFTIRVDDILKGQLKDLASKEIVTDRLGGYVLYPNGKKLLHSVHGLLMPRVGKNYLFFLADTHESPNFEIISGYELAGDKISSINPRDLLPTFASMDSTMFTAAVRREIASPERRREQEER